MREFQEELIRKEVTIPLGIGLLFSPSLSPCLLIPGSGQARREGEEGPGGPPFGALPTAQGTAGSAELPQTLPTGRFHCIPDS